MLFRKSALEDAVIIGVFAISGVSLGSVVDAAAWQEVEGSLGYSHGAGRGEGGNWHRLSCRRGGSPHLWRGQRSIRVSLL